ncbi:MAG: hypothetical protein J7494_03060 [Sphingobium sp.]|nr:hypothetical protein [Sphingobium sp.]
MNRNRRKPGNPAVEEETAAKPGALFGKNEPPEGSPTEAGGERPKIAAQDGLADHQRNPLAPPITITANS